MVNVSPFFYSVFTVCVTFCSSLKDNHRKNESGNFCCMIFVDFKNAGAKPRKQFKEPLHCDDTAGFDNSN